MASYKTFEDLPAYQAGRELRKAVSVFARTLPQEERYLLKSQILGSSRSVTANIAEGFGRHHHQENIQFCRQARGSLTETLDHFNAALDDEYLDQAGYDHLRGLLEVAWRELNGYITYLKRCATGGVPKGESDSSENRA